MKCPVCDNTMSSLFYTTYCSHCGNDKTKKYVGFVALWKNVYLSNKANNDSIPVAGGLIKTSLEKAWSNVLGIHSTRNNIIIAEVSSSKEFKKEVDYLIVHNLPKEETEIKITKIFEK